MSTTLVQTAPVQEEGMGMGTKIAIVVFVLVVVGLGIWAIWYFIKKSKKLENAQYFAFYDGSSCSGFPTGGYKYTADSCELITVAGSGAFATDLYIKNAVDTTTDTPELVLYSDSTCKTASTTTLPATFLENLISTEKTCTSTTTSQFVSSTTLNGIYYTSADWPKASLAMFEMFSDSACTTATQPGIYFVANISSTVPTTTAAASLCRGTDTVIGNASDSTVFYRGTDGDVVSYSYSGTTCTGTPTELTPSTAGCIILGTVSGDAVYGKEV